MRKNKIFGKNLDLYATYEVKGYNLDRLINECKRKEIDLFDVKKKDKTVRITLKYVDVEKFFAITENLCYNKEKIKKIKEKGKAYPLLFLKKNLGIFLGTVAFIFIAIFSSDYIFSFSFSGTGSIYKKDVEAYLKKRGITTFTRFSSINLTSLEDEILANNSHLLFVSAKKEGNRLSLELVLLKEDVKTVDDSVEELLSTEDGIIEDVKVYRGTALVEKGDSVKKGDVLVGGYYVIKDQTVKVNVFATVTILYEKRYEYKSKNDKEVETAEIFALNQSGDGEVISCDTVVEKIKDEFVYFTKVTLKRVLNAG